MEKVELYNIKSKKTGQDVPCVKVTIGVYESLLFPSKAELEYIKTYLRTSAREDFQKELSDD